VLLDDSTVVCHEVSNISNESSGKLDRLWTSFFGRRIFLFGSRSKLDTAFAQHRAARSPREPASASASVNDFQAIDSTPE